MKLDAAQIACIAILSVVLLCSLVLKKPWIGGLAFVNQRGLESRSIDLEQAKVHAQRLLHLIRSQSATLSHFKLISS